MAYTYEEFNNIDSWWELRDFCEEYGVWPDNVDPDNVVDNEWITDRVQEWARDCEWSSIRDLLRYLSNGDDGEVFEYDNYGNLNELTDEDLETAKDQVLAGMHNEGILLDGEEDDEEEEEEEEDLDEPENEPPRQIYVPPRVLNGLYGEIRTEGGFVVAPKQTFRSDDLLEFLSGGAK